MVLEAIGGLESYIPCEHTTSGLPVAVINPRQARDFVKVLGVLAKTGQVHALAWHGAFCISYQTRSQAAKKQ